jgi:hypothetical protein
MSPTMRAFWRLRTLTMQRASEVGGMKWTDLNLGEKLWIIPSMQVGPQGTAGNMWSR